MCIRDSIERQAEIRDLHVVVLVDHDIGRLDVAVHDALPIGCLLYTSDAADERSSVDLGGRRIIKKKTDEDHDGTDEI